MPNGGYLRAHKLMVLYSQILNITMLIWKSRTYSVKHFFLSLWQNKFSTCKKCSAVRIILLVKWFSFFEEIASSKTWHNKMKVCSSFSNLIDERKKKKESICWFLFCSVSSSTTYKIFEVLFSIFLYFDS